MNVSQPVFDSLLYIDYVMVRLASVSSDKIFFLIICLIIH